MAGKLFANGRMIKVAAEGKMQIDPVAGAFVENGEKGGTGIEGTALGFKDGNDIYEAALVLAERKFFGAFCFGDGGG